MMKPRSGDIDGFDYVAAARLGIATRSISVGLHPRLSDAAAARLI
jgi:hypothetical protein